MIGEMVFAKGAMGLFVLREGTYSPFLPLSPHKECCEIVGSALEHRDNLRHFREGPLMLVLFSGSKRATQSSSWCAVKESCIKGIIFTGLVFKPIMFLLKNANMVAELQKIFQVKKSADKYLFISLKLNNLEELTNDIFGYFLDEQVLFSHLKWRFPDIPFTPTAENHLLLYNCLKKLCDWDDVPLRGDKKGKMGELLLSILLERYFSYTCVIPKIMYTSSNNMSVYGMDADYYVPQDNMFVFGEAKVTNDLYSGVAQANASLREYEKKIEQEYLLILTQEYLQERLAPEIQTKLAGFYSDGNLQSIAAPFQKVCESLEITSVGIAVFICHGVDVDEDSIMKELDKVCRASPICGLEARYIVISMPVGDKEFVMKGMSDLIKKRVREYETGNI